MLQYRQRAADGRIKVDFDQGFVLIDTTLFKTNPGGLANVVDPNIDALILFNDLPQRGLYL